LHIFFVFFILFAHTLLPIHTHTSHSEMKSLTGDCSYRRVEGGGQEEEEEEEEEAVQ
jgi:hypothetical protein